MTNPIFTTNQAFNGRATQFAPENTYGGPQQTYPNPAQYQAAQQANMAGHAFNPRGEVPTMAPAGVRPLTYDDVLIKTAATFGVLLLAAGVTWFLGGTNPRLAQGMMVVGMIGGLIVGLIGGFSRAVSPLIALAYAALEGLMLGGFSAFMEMYAPGVVFVAVSATLVTFVVMLALFKTKILQASPKFNKVVAIGLFSIFIFYMGRLILSLFVPSFFAGPPLMIGPFPAWLLVSLAAVILASLSLITDFDYVTRAVEAGADSRLAWTAAFGFMVTLIWLYIEFLRIAQYFMSND